MNLQNTSLRLSRGPQTRISVLMVDKTDRVVPLADSAFISDKGALVLRVGEDVIEIVAAGQWQRVYLSDSTHQGGQV